VDVDPFITSDLLNEERERRGLALKSEAEDEVLFETIAKKKKQAQERKKRLADQSWKTSSIIQERIDSVRSSIRASSGAGRPKCLM